MRRCVPAWAWQAAAAVVLVVASSLITASLVRRDGDADCAGYRRPRPWRRSFPRHSVNRVASALATSRRATSSRGTSTQRMSSMPASARQKLVANLAEMRRAADEINAALARQPGDPLLEELLLNTYQDELGVIASVNQLTRTGATFVPVRQENIRL